MERRAEGAGEELGCKGEKIIQAWRKLHNEELRGSYSSSKIIRVIK
jgi:hypothetical protein